MVSGLRQPPDRPDLRSGGDRAPLTPGGITGTIPAVDGGSTAR